MEGRQKATRQPIPEAWGDDVKVKNEPQDAGNPTEMTFSAFVNDSTFHGVKYIFEDAHVFRR